MAEEVMDKNLDTYDTTLTLGLGYAGRNSLSSNPRLRTLKQEPTVSNLSSVAPSLSLCLPGDVYRSTQVKLIASKASLEVDSLVLSSYPSITSSFSKVVGEEAERVLSSRAGDDDDEGGARKKLRLTKEQSALLEDRFMEHSTLYPKQKQDLAKQLGLRPRQVEVWFQNRRARTKMKQTEVECEVLRRCCKTLTDENRRLQKELRELKAFKIASPLYMQFPGATLTVCPSCEKVTGAATAAPTKSQLFNAFTRSAAC